jgi:hypothetical protein
MKIMKWLKKNATSQRVLPETWHFVPPAKIRLVDVRNFDELEKHADAWQNLFIQTTAQSPVLAYPWVSAFFKHKTSINERWLCLFAYESGQLVGVLPLIASYSYRLPLVSPLLFKLPYDVLHTRSTDGLTLPGREDILSVFFDYLAAIPSAYPVLSFKYLQENSPTVLYFSRGKNKMTVVKQLVGYEDLMPLPDSAAKYNESFSQNFRKYFKSNTKKLNEFGEAKFIIDDKSSSPSENTNKFLNVEDKNWKGRRSSSLKSNPSDSALFTDAAEKFDKYGMMQFNFLEINGKVIAAQYAIRSNRTLYLPKIGCDEDYLSCSPGNLLLYRVIESACDSGNFDDLNLMSDSAWHARWNVKPRPFYNLLVFPNKMVISTLLRNIIQLVLNRRMRKLHTARNANTN